MQFVLICITFVVALNVVVDPFDIYGTEIFRPFRANNYQWKAQLFIMMDPPPEALILGSSRVGTADPEIVEDNTGKRCFNWGAPTEETMTYNAIIRMAVDDYHAPIDMMIVAADPEIFHPGRTVHPQAVSAIAYEKYLAGKGIRSAIKRTAMKFIQTISWEQTVASLTVLWREISGRESDAQYTYRDDGLMLFAGSDDQIASGTYDLEAMIDRRLPTYPDRNLCFVQSDEMSESAMNRWVEFLDYCVGNEIEIYVYITPQHERYREMLRDLGSENIYGEITEYLRMTVEERGGIFRDYSIPETFGGDPEMFYDEVHPRKENNDLILRDLLAGYQ